MTVEIRDSIDDPWEELGRYQQQLVRLKGHYGATSVFVGTMRDFNEAVRVQAMHLEHYPGMTEKELEKMAGQALERWDLLDVFILHRVGEVRPNDAIVVIGVWSTHRAAAFAACRFLIEALKTKAPFWKRELTDEGERWVTENTTTG